MPRKPSALALVRDAMGGEADMVSRNADGIVIRRGYFYRFGGSAEKFAEKVARKLESAGLNAIVLGYYDHWAPFRGGRGVAHNSHFAVVVRLTD